MSSRHYQKGMDSQQNYIATPSAEYTSRELEAFKSAINNEPSRFTRVYSKMFDIEWASNELIPFFQRVYSNTPGIGPDYDWWTALDTAEWVEPKHMPNYPIDDPVFLERLRLALISPTSVPRPSLVLNVAEDAKLTVRLLLRRHVLHGGPFELASLPDNVRPELAEEVQWANVADGIGTGWFAAVGERMATRK